MPSLTLSPAQRRLARQEDQSKTFLEGPAGAGKTTAGVQRLLHLLDAGVPADAILVLVPQRTLARPYADALHGPALRAGGAVSILTAGGLARRAVDLFWPLVAEAAGFARPDAPPTFLTLETAQYYMARLVRPLLEEEGLFDSVTIDRNRLYSQILDNLNKAALVGFSHREIGSRLLAAHIGDPAQARVYADVQHCADLFRQYCLAHNLLDFSLQVEVFRDHLLPLPACRGHLTATYRHLIADNVEEDTPFAHDLLRDWLPDLDSALLIYDRDAGYRSYLGADPTGARELRSLCRHHVVFADSWVASADVQALARELDHVLRRPLQARQAATGAPAAPHGADGDPGAVLAYESDARYYPEMLDWVAGQIADLVHEQGVPPREIVVLAPFLSDALRFSLVNRLERQAVPVRSHRPSRALRDEPATHCLLTLAALAHPHWGVHPGKFDFAYALVQAVADMDLVRAQLLAEIVFRVREGVPALSSFDQIDAEVRERITYLLGGRYEGLRIWLADYIAGQRPQASLDHFLARLFGELLSQPGYGFHADVDAGEVAANLVESVQKFRWVAERDLAATGKALGREYLQMVADGVIAAQYIRSWQIPRQQDNVVLLAPAHTFLMSNRPVSYQFWLDVGSRGWYERLYQPLTHPYVLSRHWPAGTAWTDVEEFAASQERLACLATGLLRRCRHRVFLGLSQLGEQGYEHRGPLLLALHHVLQQRSLGSATAPEAPQSEPETGAPPAAPEGQT